MRWYITDNINKCEPSELLNIPHTHIKCRTDGSSTVIMCNDLVDLSDIEGVTEVSKAEAQDILDYWIARENDVPEIGLNGEEVIQSKIDLEVFCG